MVTVLSFNAFFSSPPGTFLLMACVTLIGWEFWFLCLPETKGKSLEEAELLFTKPFFKKIKLKTEKNEEPVFI